MNEESQITTKPRKPSDAACLAALLPGLGHLYYGHFQRGIFWMGASISLMIAAILTLIVSSSRGGFTLAMVFIAIDVVLWIICVAQSWRLGKRSQSSYALREYNRWYVYAILFLLCGFGSAVGLAFVLRERVVQAFVIPTSSMEPTINRGDRILTLKETYLDRDPERGELVIFRNPMQRRQHWVKRVIAIAGDHIEWRANGDIVVNDTLLSHTSTSTLSEFTEEQGDHRYTIRLEPGNDTQGPSSFGSSIVPAHHCFVLGDNRFLSKDSRHFGPVAYTGLVADPVAKVWGGFGKLE